MRPSSTAAMAGSASGFILTNHCVETSGSTAVLQRWHRAEAELVGLRSLTSRPSFFEVGDDALAGFEAVEAGVGAGGGGHLRVLVDDLDDAAGCGACRLRSRWGRARA